MRSRFEHLRSMVVNLRKRGKSIREIERNLGIPRSTLSYWFKSIFISERHQLALKRKWDNALVKARVGAVRWHNAQKQQRLDRAKLLADTILSKIDHTDHATLELALALLYLGEGSKKNSSTTLGSSDPIIAKFFVECIKNLYHLPIKDIRCHLHLRADQDEKKMKRFWAKTLNLPINRFGKTSFDKRTAGRPTYDHYKGVCTIGCGRVEIQRRLVYIAYGFCEAVAKGAVSSVGRASA